MEYYGLQETSDCRSAIIIFVRDLQQLEHWQQTDDNTYKADIVQVLSLILTGFKALVLCTLVYAKKCMH